MVDANLPCSGGGPKPNNDLDRDVGNNETGVPLWNRRLYESGQADDTGAHRYVSSFTILNAPLPLPYTSMVWGKGGALYYMLKIVQCGTV